MLLEIKLYFLYIKRYTCANNDPIYEFLHTIVVMFLWILIICTVFGSDKDKWGRSKIQEERPSDCHALFCNDRKSATSRFQSQVSNVH